MRIHLLGKKIIIAKKKQALDTPKNLDIRSEAPNIQFGALDTLSVCAWTQNQGINFTN